MGKETQVMVEARKIATVYNVVAGKVDNINKAEFNKVYELIKFEEGRDEAVKALSEASKGITLESRKREFNRVLQMAIVYCSMNKAVTYSLVSWDNLKTVVRLYRYVAKNYDEAICQRVIKELDVYSKGISMERYNNALETKARVLKELYKVAEVKKSVEFEQVLVEVDTLTQEEKRQLLARLMEEVGSMEVAA